MYATYEDYTAYGGGMSEADYAVWGVRASRAIDAKTFDRAAAAPPCMAERLRACCCELADTLQREDALNTATCRGALSAATNDGTSESYGNYKDARAAMQAELRAVLMRWLCAPVNLMYPGV